MIRDILHDPALLVTLGLILLFLGFLLYSAFKPEKPTYGLNRKEIADDLHYAWQALEDARVKCQEVPDIPKAVLADIDYYQHGMKMMIGELTKGPNMLPDENNLPKWHNAPNPPKLWNPNHLARWSKNKLKDEELPGLPVLNAMLKEINDKVPTRVIFVDEVLESMQKMVDEGSAFPSGHEQKLYDDKWQEFWEFIEKEYQAIGLSPSKTFRILCTNMIQLKTKQDQLRQREKDRNDGRTITETDWRNNDGNLGSAGNIESKSRYSNENNIMDNEEE